MAIKCPKCQTDNPETASFCADCGTQLLSSKEISAPTETLEAAKEELTRGTTFASRYEIIEELGKGGMGKVYRVEDKKIKEEVALKLIKPEIASDKKTIERFSNELKMARKIAHRNVCRMFDLGEEKESHYITMEYVPGEDLKSMIRMTGQLSVGTAINITKQVCEGLTEAHRLGVVHRDLKPSNIMIDKEGNARIMDFGIARSIVGKGITGDGVMLGTPEYMSPEQAEVKEVDQRSDIYSLGVILYEMLTGRVPFEGETPLGIAMKHKSEVPKDPKELNTQVTDELSRVILRCLEKEKDKRYQSAGEVHSELENIEKGIPTTERVIPKRKPITSREITVTFGLKKLFIPALVIIALVIAMVITWQLLPKKEAVSIPSDKPSIAIMYFENNTGDESLDHWRKMFSDLLITDLTQSKYLRVLSGDRLFKILNDINQLETKTFSADVLKEVADRGRVNHILRGSYSKAGNTIRIDIMLQDAGTGEPIATERVEGTGEESIFSLVDELTKKIKTNFNLSEEAIASDIDREIGKITTSSPEALKYYAEGKKYYDTGEFRKSVTSMENAVEIDPKFAMAYRYISKAYARLGYRSEFRKYSLKALELSDRLSDRERYIIQTNIEGNWDKQIEAWEKLIELYPTDAEANSSLGGLYARLEQWDRAIERYIAGIQSKSDISYRLHSQLATAYMAKGMYNEARDVLENYLDNYSDNALIRLVLASSYLCQEKLDLALLEVEKALSFGTFVNESIRLRGHIYICKGDLEKAGMDFQKLLESDERPHIIRGRLGLASINLLQGKFEEAKNQLEKGGRLAEDTIGSSQPFYHLNLAYTYLRSGNHKKALGISVEEKGCLACHQRRALHFKGLSYIEMKSLDEARKTAYELKEMMKEGLNKNLARLNFHIDGMIEFERKNYYKAIDFFKKACSLLPFQYEENDRHALFIEPLALAYYKIRELDKAQEEYERITSLTTGRIYYNDIFAKSFYMLAMIYEQKGWKGKAIEHYEKFLDLWKDADPGIAEVEDAKKRLAALKGQ